MKNNLEAKFYDAILKATKQELPTIERIEILVDSKIDNPSYVNVVDCSIFYKQSLKTDKKVSIKINKASV